MYSDHLVCIYGTNKLMNIHVYRGQPYCRTNRGHLVSKYGTIKFMLPGTVTGKSGEIRGWQGDL